MKTAMVMKKAFAVLFVVLLAAAPVAAQTATPADSALESLREKLTSAQWKVAGGDVEAGRKLIAEVKRAARPELASRVQVAEKLADAVEAEKAGNQPQAIQTLKTAAGAAQEGEQDQVVLAIGLQFVRRQLAGGNAPQASALVSSLTTGRVADSEDLGVQLRITGLHLAVNDLGAAETALTRAAPLAKTKPEWSGLSWSAIDLFKRNEKAGTGAAVYARIAKLLATNEARAAVLDKFLDEARSRAASGNTDGAATILDLIRAEAAIPELKPARDLVAQVTAVHTRAGSGDFGGAFAALRQANTLAGDDRRAVSDVYRTGARLTRAMLTAKKVDDARQVVAFLKEGPGKQVDEFSRRRDLAGFHITMKEFAEAEGEIRQIAPVCRRDYQWNTWTALVWSLARAQESGEVSAALLRTMAPLAGTQKARENLVGEFVDGARSMFIVGKGTDTEPILEAAQNMAADSPALAASVETLRGALVAEKALKAKNLQDALDALRNAQRAAGAKDQRILYNIGTSLAQDALAADSKQIAGETVRFLKDGPARAVDTLWSHMGIARFHLALGELDEADAELRRTAPLCKKDADWSMWAGLVWQVAAARKTVNDTIASFEKMLPLAAGNAAKTQLVGNFLSGVLPYLTGRDVAKGRALLDGVKPAGTGLPGVAQQLSFLEKLAAAQQLAEADKHLDAIQALKDAYGIAKDDQSLSVSVYRVGIAFARERKSEKDTASVEALAAFLVSGPGKDVPRWTRWTDAASLRLATGDVAAAEQALIQAPGMDKHSEAAWKVWFYAAVGVINTQETPENAAASASRLATALKTDAGKRVVLGDILASARTDIGGIRVGRGRAVFNALKGRASGVTGLKPVVAVMTKMVSARSLSDNGRHADALKRLEEAAAISKGDKAELRDIYVLGKHVAQQAIKDKNRTTAVSVVQFLKGRPAEGVEPYWLHVDLARLHTGLGDIEAAEAEVIRAAGLIETEQQADFWRGVAWRAADLRKGVADLIAAYGRMLKAAPSDMSRQRLVGRFLTGARGYLCARDVAKGRVLFETVKADAAEQPDHVRIVGQLEHMSEAHRLSKAGDYAGALRELQETYTFAKGDRMAVYELQMAAGRIFRTVRAGGDAKTATAIVAFMNTEPGSEQEPVDVHGGSARRFASMQDFAKAEAELRKAAPADHGEAKWKDWAEDLLTVAKATKSAETAKGIFDRLADVTKSDPAKAAFSMARARMLVALAEPAEAEKQVQKVTGDARDVAGVKYGLAALYAKRGRMNDAYRIFRQAETVAQPLKDDERDALIRSAFYYRTHVRNGLPTLLAREVRARKDEPVPDRIVRGYVEAAAAGAEGDEALRLLGQVSAKPRHYYLLAKHLRDYGDVGEARKALDAISRKALSADPKLAADVRGFWPSDDDRTRDEIERCRSLVRVYSGRAAAAKAKGRTTIAKRFEQQVKALEKRIAALEKELGQ